jgi:hypothetical protein
MGKQRHFDRVRGLVAGHTGVPETGITLETRLVEDLDMDGDTGHEFLESFADEFSVDMSRTDGGHGARRGGRDLMDVHPIAPTARHRGRGAT